MSDQRSRKQPRDNNDDDFRNKRQKDSHQSGREHKIMSAIGTVAESNRLGRRKDEDYTETSKPTISEAYKKPEVLNRNKRMFGLLMGHLGMARQKLEADSDIIKKQSEISLSVAEKNAKEAQRLEVLRRKERQQQIYDAKVVNIKNSFQGWKNHMESLVHFIFTDTEPKISWLPANHNKLSRDMLKARNDEVLRRIAEREVSDEKKLKELEESYLSQNMEENQEEYQENVAEEPVESVDVEEVGGADAMESHVVAVVEDNHRDGETGEQIAIQPENTSNENGEENATAAVVETGSSNQEGEGVFCHVVEENGINSEVAADHKAEEEQAPVTVSESQENAPEPETKAD